jgi:aryl-alcohol dehydrogenase-like predicted oxidoreductase
MATIPAKSVSIPGKIYKKNLSCACNGIQSVVIFYATGARRECLLKYKLFGKSGLRVSELCLGAMVFGDARRVGATKEDSQEIFNANPDDPNAGGNHRKNLALSLETSLRLIHTDHIDLLLVHAWDFLTPVEEVMRALDDQVRAGKVLSAVSCSVTLSATSFPWRALWG